MMTSSSVGFCLSFNVVRYRSYRHPRSAAAKPTRAAASASKPGAPRVEAAPFPPRGLRARAGGPPDFLWAFLGGAAVPRPPRDAPPQRSTVIHKLFRDRRGIALKT